MSKGLVFVCFLASLCCCVIDAVDFTFDIIPHRTFGSSIIECKQDENDKANVTVLENQELILKARGNNLCYILECTIMGDHNEVKSDVKDYLLPRQLSVTVTKDLGTTWNCSILINNEAGIVQPVYNYYGKTRKDRDPEYKTYSIAYCVMQLHVRREMTPQIVLVNDMILPTIQETNNELPYDHSAVYNYYVGDLIYASCIIGNTESENTPKLSFTYDYAERFYEGGLAPESFNINPNSIGYGFRTTMGTEHDKHVMICKYWDEYDYTIIKITFIAANQLENNTDWIIGAAAVIFIIIIIAIVSLTIKKYNKNTRLLIRSEPVPKEASNINPDQALYVNLELAGMEKHDQNDLDEESTHYETIE